MQHTIKDHEKFRVATESEVSTRRGRLYARLIAAPRAVRYLAALVLGVVSYLGLSGPASAATDEGDGTALGLVDVMKQNMALTIVAVSALIGIAFAFWMVVAWVKRAKNKA